MLLKRACAGAQAAVRGWRVRRAVARASLSWRQSAAQRSTSADISFFDPADISVFDPADISLDPDEEADLLALADCPEAPALSRPPTARVPGSGYSQSSPEDKDGLDAIRWIASRGSGEGAGSSGEMSSGRLVEDSSQEAHRGAVIDSDAAAGTSSAVECALPSPALHKIEFLPHQPSTDGSGPSAAHGHHGDADGGHDDENRVSSRGDTCLGAESTCSSEHAPAAEREVWHEGKPAGSRSHEEGSTAAGHVPANSEDASGATLQRAACRVLPGSEEVLGGKVCRRQVRRTAQHWQPVVGTFWQERPWAITHVFGLTSGSLRLHSLAPDLEKDQKMLAVLQTGRRPSRG